MALEFDFILPRRDFDLSLKGVFDQGITGIYGPSGAGKTSFFNVLAGLERPKMGTITLNGRVLSQGKYFLPPHKRRVAVVFQEKLLFPHLNIRDNILFGVSYGAKKLISFDQLVDILDLEDILNSRTWLISGGEQQRVAIARALMISPELLLMDEPFNAVDNSLRATILPYLRTLRDELDIPMVVISHDLPDLQRLTDSFYLIERGENTGFGSIHTLMGESYHRDNLSDMVNVLKLTEPEILPHGEYSCVLKESPGTPIICTKAPAKDFTMMLSPGDIALSRKYLPHISVQNQIEGVVTSIQNIGNGSLCFIKAGIPLVAHITNMAMEQLRLSEGDSLFCLFKAQALKY